MNVSKAAIRYAKALLQQGQEGNGAEALFGDMQTVLTTIHESKELRVMLQSPVIKGEDKKNALLEIFKGCSKDTHSLINALVSNQRTPLLGEVAQGYVHLYNESRGVKVAQVTTAVPMSSDLEAKVLTKVKELTGSDNVSIENKVDESIIGGFVLRVGDLQYNASIANQLGNLKREFSKSL